MLMTPSRRCCQKLLPVCVFLLAVTVRAQEKPDRPPCAQKSKPAPDAAPTSTAPGSPADSESAKIVQRAPSQNSPDTQDPSGQRSRIRVDVNLVNVLVSVLDEHNRPAPDLRAEAFQLFEEGV